MLFVLIKSRYRMLGNLTRAWENTLLLIHNISLFLIGSNPTGLILHNQLAGTKFERCLQYKEDEVKSILQ